MKSAYEKICVSLFAVFVTLKITGNIDWSWWYVTIPLWVVPVLFLIFGLSKIAVESAIKSSVGNKK